VTTDQPILGQRKLIKFRNRESRCAPPSAAPHGANRPPGSPNAAGVIPSIRPACPTVHGRAAVSFAHTSLDSLGTLDKPLPTNEQALWSEAGLGLVESYQVVQGAHGNRSAPA
jgi:hypothetical protein